VNLNILVHDTAFMRPTLAIHDHARPYPRSHATLSTITRNPIHDHTQPYPRSHATLSTITRNPIHDHTRPYPRSRATLSTITRDPIHDQTRSCHDVTVTMLYSRCRSLVPMRRRGNAVQTRQRHPFKLDRFNGLCLSSHYQ